MFLNKAKNLQYIKDCNLKNLKVPKFFFFKVKDWEKNKKNICQYVNESLNDKICIRSSFILEDHQNYSLAGKFDSFIKVKNSKKNINFFTKDLINQYKKFTSKKKYYLNSHVIIQEFVKDSICSGVVTNYSISDGAPYYTINYDDTSNSTSSVTSGSKDSFRVLYVSRGNLRKLRSKKFLFLIRAVQQIENKYKDQSLDIEFAIDKKLNVNILQARPISKKIKWKKINKEKINTFLKYSEKKYKKINKKNFKYGKKGVFGLMPDWNPAEIIGFHPHLFSYSLYKYLVTNDAWAKAREEMGYKNILNYPLMYSFSGKPYIDTRLSFNSLLPKNINNNLGRKITTYWTNSLIKKPYYHDKIEFEITENCFHFKLTKVIKKNYSFLSQKEKIFFLESLRTLTNNIVSNYFRDFESYSKKIIFLEKMRINNISRYLNSKNDEIFYSRKIMDLCRENGIIPFAKFARNAFIAKKILISFVELNILKKNTYAKILKKLKTISHDYINDKKNLSLKKINKEFFIKKYFHLRPGSYDILSERYNSKLLKNELKDNEIKKILNLDLKNINNLLSKKEIISIDKILKKNHFSINCKSLINYCINSMKLRENSKFLFTRSLSDSIELIKIWSKKNNADSFIQDLSLKNIFKTSKLRTKKLKRSEIYKKYYKNNKLREYYKLIKLPYLIVSKDDFYVSSVLLSKPNYITEKIIDGDLIKLDNQSDKINLKGKIIAIENADPGYDWIFSHKIKGLITKFGGVNSHMSIRCEELNVPAIIGFGEDNFSKINNGDKININCKLEKVNFENL